jgi:uncharacterized protein YktB (UPF0637 family)
MKQPELQIGLRIEHLYAWLTIILSQPYHSKNFAKSLS